MTNKPKTCKQQVKNTSTLNMTQPKVDKTTDYNKGFEAGVRTVASAIGREKTFDAKLFNGNYFLKQPDGTYFSINSLSKYKDK